MSPFRFLGHISGERVKRKEVQMGKRVSDENIEQTILTYSDMLYKICFLILKNEQDVKDVLQETFIKYIMLHSPLMRLKTLQPSRTESNLNALNF